MYKTGLSFYLHDSGAAFKVRTDMRIECQKKKERSSQDLNLHLDISGPEELNGLIKINILCLYIISTRFSYSGNSGTWPAIIELLILLMLQRIPKPTSKWPAFTYIDQKPILPCQLDGQTTAKQSMKWISLLAIARMILKYLSRWFVNLIPIL